MKKNRILLIFAVFLIISYIFTLFLQIGDFKCMYYWFSFACFFIGQYSLMYYMMYKLDSSLYYGTLSVLIGIISFVQHYFALSLSFYYPFYFLSASFASFAVFVLFRQKIHFKLFAFLSLECILLMLYKLSHINFWQLVTLNGIYLLITGLNFAFRIKKNLKEN